MILAAPSIFLQVPLPSGDVWLQFPMLAAIVLCLFLFFGGMFTFAKWLWSEYKKEAEKERKWREDQNAIREAAQDTRDEKMMAFFKAISAGNASDISDMRTTSEKITKALDTLLAGFSSHDLRARDLWAIVTEIRTDLAKITK